MDRRNFLVGTGASTAAFAAGPVFAQEAFPSHAITIINAFPPGGADDLVTRPFAVALEPVVKQPVVVEPRRAPAARSALRSPQAPSRMAIHCCPTTMESPATRKSTSCSVGNPKPRVPISFRWHD